MKQHLHHQRNMEYCQQIELGLKGMKKWAPLIWGSRISVSYSSRVDASAACSFSSFFGSSSSRSSLIVAATVIIWSLILSGWKKGTGKTGQKEENQKEKKEKCKTKKVSKQRSLHQLPLTSFLRYQYAPCAREKAKPRDIEHKTDMERRERKKKEKKRKK